MQVTIQSLTPPEPKFEVLPAINHLPGTWAKDTGGYYYVLTQLGTQSGRVWVSAVTGKAYEAISAGRLLQAGEGFTLKVV